MRSFFAVPAAVMAVAVVVGLGSTQARAQSQPALPDLPEPAKTPSMTTCSSGM